MKNERGIKSREASPVVGRSRFGGGLKGNKNVKAGTVGKEEKINKQPKTNVDREKKGRTKEGGGEPTGKQPII